jgi:hypothetical protein
MTNATVTENTVAPVADTTATAPVAAPAAPKAPSKKSQALTIFNEQMALRAAGKFASNKEFRATVLHRIVGELAVTMASASTMYNAAKKDAETADATVALGRDPKKEKAPAGTGKRGRPVGSKNKAKEAAPAADAAVPGTVVEPGEVLVVVDAQPEATVVTVDVEVEAPAAPAADAEAVPA